MTRYETERGSVSDNDITCKRITRLYLGDNLDAMREMGDESVDLVYLDPPFNSNRNYKIVFRGPEALRPMAHLPAFEDVWTWDEEAEGLSDGLLSGASGRSVADAIQGLMTLVGRNRLMAYIVNMTPRLAEIKRLLRQTGTVYLHCDPTASHYLKVIMDAVFGGENFRNEIAWCYRGGGVPRQDFARKHDVILRYSKSERYVFNPQYTEYSDASKTLVKSRGGVSIDDRIRDLGRGAHMPDWWSDINSLQTWSPERTGYPTQKPVQLLERIIRSSSNEGDDVMDPFCGCGTTMVAAERLGRSWIGIDIEPLALSVLRQRFARENLLVDFEVVGLPPIGAKDYANWTALAVSDPFRFERAAITQIPGCIPWRNLQHQNKGIEGLINLPVDVSDHRYAIVRVNGGEISDVSILNELCDSIADEQGRDFVVGMLVVAHEPSQDLLATAAQAGEFKSSDLTCPRLSVVTLGEIFQRMNRNLPVLPISVPSN